MTAAETRTLSFFDISTPARRFRLVAVIEAITWALLLIGMGVKYGAGIEAATMVVGMLHGLAFAAYVLVVVLSVRPLRWDWTVTLLALAAAVPPFFTILFEWWAKRKGYLAELSTGDGVALEVDTVPEREPADHLLWAILVTFLCFPPFGIAAWVMSSKVGQRWADGDRAGAQQAADKARNLVLLSVLAGIVVAVFAVLLVTVGPPGGA